MKYIRAQNGMILSVSQLIPPAKGSRHEALSGAEVEIWRLNVITADGQRHTYAVYTDMEHAIDVFSNRMIPFIYGDDATILFELGENADPYIEKADTTTSDGASFVPVTPGSEGGIGMCLRSHDQDGTLCAKIEEYDVTS